MPHQQSLVTISSLKLYPTAFEVEDMELTEAWLSSFHHLKKADPRQINAGEPVDAASERGAQQDTVLCA